LSSGVPFVESLSPQDLAGPQKDISYYPKALRDSCYDWGQRGIRVETLGWQPVDTDFLKMRQQEYLPHFSNLEEALQLNLF
jgi:hypothetical protein